MAILQRLMGHGMSGYAATSIVGSNANGLTATGSTQTDALLVSAVINQFTTVGSGTGAILPACSPSDAVFIYNGGSNALSVYGQGTEAIQNGSASAAFSLAANKGAYFIKIAPSNWAALLSA